MSNTGLFLVALAIAVGIVGTIIPVLPGLPVAWAAVLVWVIVDDGGVGHWMVLLVVTVLMAVGIAAKYVLSSRRIRERGAPWTTMAAAGLGGLVGFFVIPVVGLFVGLAVGAFAAEYHRLKDLQQAWSSAWAVLLALGIGTLIEIAAGLLMALAWGLGVLAT